MRGPRPIPGQRSGITAMQVVAAVAAVVVTLGTGCVRLAGTVYIDRNGDGLRQVDEPVVPGVVVARDRTDFVVTDAEGRYYMQAPGVGGVVWARVPSGFQPGPVWRRLDDVDGMDLGLVPLSDEAARSPLTFVVAADSHVTTAVDEPRIAGAARRGAC